MLDMLRSHDLRLHDLSEITMCSNSKRPCLTDSCDLPQNILTAMKYLENCKWYTILVSVLLEIIVCECSIREYIFV